MLGWCALGDGPREVSLVPFPYCRAGYPPAVSGLFLPGVSAVGSAFNRSLDASWCSSVLIIRTFHVALPTSLALVLTGLTFVIIGVKVSGFPFF